MKRCNNEKRDARLSMDAKGRFYPAQAGGQLEKKQDEIDHAQNEYN